MPQHAQSPQARQPLKFSTLLSLWLAALGITLAVGAIIITQINQRHYSAEAFAAHYLQLLREGDGAAALGLLENPEVKSQAVLLDGEPLKASMARLKRLEVGAATAAEDRQLVPVSFTLDGRRTTVNLHLKHTGHQWLFFDQWSIEDQLAVVQFTSQVPARSVSVNGVPSPLQRNTAEFASFVPGSVDVASPGKYLSGKANNVLIDRAGQTTEVKLSPAPTPALVKAVEKDLNAFLDRCTHNKVLNPTGCPFSYSTTDRVNAESIEWSIVQRPKVSIIKHEQNWEVPTMKFTARLKFTGTDLQTGASRDYDETLDTEIGVKLKVDKNQYYAKPFLTPEWLAQTNTDSE